MFTAMGRSGEPGGYCMLYLCHRCFVQDLFVTTDVCFFLSRLSM